MIISISGALGSGKSTIGKRLAETLNWPHYYMGGLRRLVAKKRGLTLAEYNKLGESDPETDMEVDRYQAELGKNQDNFVIEGRTSWHFIPHSLKIYLGVTPEIGAQRIFNDLKTNSNRNEDRHLNSWEETLKSNEDRLKSDRFRYRKYFGIDVYDQNHYDFCLDTSNLSVNEVFNKILEFVESKRH